MRQIVTLLILAAVGVGAWLAWPTIKAKFLAYQESGASSKERSAPPSVPPSTPNASSTIPPTTDTGTPSATVLGPTTPGPKTPEPPSPQGDNEKTSTPPLNGKPFRVDFSADLVQHGTISNIEGLTTLPVGTQLQVQILPDGDDRLPPVLVVVAAGSPRNVFGFLPRELVTAKSFRMMVTLHPGVQPANVKELIGSRGELLTGSLISRTSAGNQLHAVSAPFTPVKSVGLKERRVKLVFKSLDSEQNGGKAPGP